MYRHVYQDKIWRLWRTGNNLVARPGLLYRPWIGRSILYAIQCYIYRWKQGTSVHRYNNRSSGTRNTQMIISPYRPKSMQTTPVSLLYQACPFNGSRHFVHFFSKA